MMTMMMSATLSAATRCSLRHLPFAPLVFARQFPAPRAAAARRVVVALAADSGKPACASVKCLSFVDAAFNGEQNSVHQTIADVIHALTTNAVLPLNAFSELSLFLRDASKRKLTKIYCVVQINNNSNNNK